MITNFDILRSINKVIHDNFRDCDIVIDEQTQDVNKPTFFVSVHELSSVSRLGYTEDLVQAYITYTNKPKMAQKEKLQVKQELKTCFDLDLEILNEDRNVLIIDNRKFQDIGDAITMTLTLNFLNGKDKERDYDHKGSCNMEVLHYEDNKEKITL